MEEISAKEKKAKTKNPMVESMEVKTRIKEVMEEKGIKPVELSERIGIEKGNLSAIINDKRNPTLKTLMAIAYVLGVNITELFVKPEQPEQQPAVAVCPHCGKPLVAEITFKSAE